MVCGLWNLGRIHFNPLPPHGGRRCSRTCGTAAACISIHSLRMEGDKIADVIAGLADISIHSLRMEGDEKAKTIGKLLDISIHSLRMEGDLLHMPAKCRNGIFQSTPSAWRETGFLTRNSLTPEISIHSLRMEGDNYF